MYFFSRRRQRTTIMKQENSTWKIEGKERKYSITLENTHESLDPRVNCFNDYNYTSFCLNSSYYNNRREREQIHYHRVIINIMWGAVAMERNKKVPRK